MRTVRNWQRLQARRLGLRDATTAAAQSGLNLRPPEAQSAFIARANDVGGGTVATGADLDFSGLDIADATEPAGSSTTTLTATAVQVGDDLSVTLTNNAISNDPLTAWHFDFSVVDVFGTVGNVDLIDVWRALIRLGQLAPITDMHVGIALVNSSTGNGMAFRLAAVSGDWQVQHAASAQGTFGPWVTSTSDGDTQALLAQLAGRGSGSAQSRQNAIALDALGVDQGGTTSTITTNGSNIGGDLDVMRVFVGMIAGGLMTAPQTITFKVGYLHFKVMDTELARSFFL